MKFSIDMAQKIKLVVWDLDETFWRGTLSDVNFGNSVEPIKKHCDLIKVLSNRGIVNAVCSKNDKQDAEEQLKSLGVLDYFVFNSINWEPKGNRLKTMLSAMALRPTNVLFIDDNPSNLAEAEFVMPELMVAGPEITEELFVIASTLGKNDTNLSRLNQYKILEQKNMAAQEYASNEDFLRSSNIRICIKTDFNGVINRIAELIARSNQLNFTKKRITADELKSIVADKSYNCGYVSVDDNYGKYGIVGFYAIKDGTLEHFLFSCRTMGMGIEQYVYAYLGYPKLTIVEPVSGNVSSDEGLPDYIHNVETLETDSIDNKQKSAYNVLIKGPCDLQVMAAFLEQTGLVSLKQEFNFMDEHGNQQDFFNHTINILNSWKFSNETIKKLTQKYSFISEDAFSTTLFSEKYDVICLSPLMDATLSVYKSRLNGSLLPFGLYNKPLTDTRYHKDYINKNVMTARSTFSIAELSAFCDEYETVEYTAFDVANNLSEILKNIWSNAPATKIVIMLLAELPCTASKDFAGKEVLHKAINSELRSMFAQEDKVYLLDVNKYVTKQADYFDNINHYSKLVYYKIANEFVNYVNHNIGIIIPTKSFMYAIYSNFKRMLYKFYSQKLK